MKLGLRDHGIEVSHGLLRRRRLIRFDEIAEVNARGVTTHDGSRYAVVPELIAPLTYAVAGPPAHDSWDACREAFAGYLDGPHGPERAVEYLCATCDRLGASDLHLEPETSGALLRLRVVGELAHFVTVPARVLPAMVAAIKVLAGCLPYRRDVVQEGRIPRAGVAADIRASFVPTAFGERVALRFFGRLRELDELGLDATSRSAMGHALDAPDGLIIVAGRTGAGKTTTLYACLAHLAAQRQGAHLSLEDPVEQRLRKAGIPVDQIELCPQRGIDGESVLAASLRQDVDVLSVGELRTTDEARLALRAAHTGRLVLAGVHAGSPEQAHRRLLDLGLEASRLEESLRLILHQDLISEACDCAGSGCATCRQLGRRRRLVATAWGNPIPRAILKSVETIA